MGLKDFARRQILARVLKEAPVVGKFFGWLTDPGAAGRKRGLTAVLAILSGGLRGATAAIRSGCAASLLPSWACYVDPETAASYVDTLTLWLDTVIVPGTDALTILMGTWALADARKKGAAIPASQTLTVPGLILALLLPGLALAQEAPDPDAVTIEIEAGAQAVVTRDARDDRGAARATLDAPLPSGFRAAVRIEASGVQAGGDLPFDPYNPKTFRSVQGIVEIRKQLATGFALGLAGGATWSIEGNDGPRDPRLYTALLLARVPLPGHGWARVGGGHHGPVGGWSAVAAVAYPAGPGRLLIDYALPVVAVDAAGAPRPWVLTTMVSVPLKRWVLGGQK